MNKEHQKLTKKVKEFMSEKAIGNNYSCPFCGKSDFTIKTSSNHIFFPEEPKKLEKETFRPYILLTCENCGHSTFFDGFISGLLDENGNVKD